jgi:regulator of RNase E activity RraA
MDISEILSYVSTSNIADACDHLGKECLWLTKGMDQTSREKFWGFADVVQWQDTRKTQDIQSKGESTWNEVKEFISNISKTKEPKVYVAGTKNPSDNYVLLGGLSITFIFNMGYQGIVCDGLIRDFEEVSQVDFPIWHTGWGVMDSQGCMRVSSSQSFCLVNGHTVEQGDLIIGDGNGAICIPKALSGQVLERAEGICEIETKILRDVRDGKNLFSIVESGGHI